MNIQYVINYMLNNMRGLIFSLSGHVLIFYVIGRISGLRYRKWPSFVVFVFFILLRYFWMELFVMSYLAERYLEEQWYGVVLMLTAAFFILLGIAGIRFLFLGSLRKNFLLELICEISYIFIIDLPEQFVRIRILGQSARKMASYETSDLLIPVFTSLIILALHRFGEPIFKQYRDWEVRRPVILDSCLIAYIGMSFISNYGMVQKNGYADYLIFSIAFAFMFIYLWYDNLHFSKLKKTARNAELAGQEKALKAHYEQTIVQTARINRYNTEIREAMSKLSANTDSYAKDYKTNSPEAGYRYLERLKRQYDALSVSRYCADPVIDQYLGQAELELKACGVEPVFMFHDYYTPSGINQQDVNAYLSWMLSGIKKDFGGGRFFLRGGIRGRSLILSCEAEGGHYEAPSEKDIRKLHRRTKADVDIRENKIVVGVPIL